MNGASDFSLDNRLALCADFVRGGAKVADIGTDHAYLPVWLCRIGRCGTAIAADTGGAIKGNRVDVCYSSKSEAYGWGVRNATVYVLK